MQERVDPINKIMLLGMLLPLCVAPLLAVEFPRVLAFLPLVSIFFAVPALIKTKGKSLLSFKKPALFCASALLLIFLHSYLVAQYQDDAFDRSVKLAIISSCGILFLASMKTLPPVRENFLILTLWFCMLGAIFISMEILTGEAIYRYIRNITAQELVSTAVYNRGALAITFLSALAFFLLENKKQIVSFVTFAGIIIMLYLGQSQSAQLVFVILSLFYFLWPSANKTGWFFIYGLIAMACFSTPFVIPYIFNHLPAFIDEIGFFRYSYVGPRFEIWDYVSRQVYESPVLGHGIEFTKNFEGFESQERYTQVSSVLHPHNFILQLWIEFGLCGILVFLGGLAALMRFMYQNLSGNHRKTALTLMMSFLFVSCFSYGIWQSWWLGLAFIISGWLVLTINQDKQARIA
jgi:O-antigen ligase